MSSIITFYSYKGGVGRSMALANIAVLLARRGYRILAVDWDLEAPGLDQYFNYFSMDVQGAGLLRMLMDFSKHGKADYRDYMWAVHSDTGHPICLLTSGRGQDVDYSRNLESFDWVSFFRDVGGGKFIEELRSRWRTDFDFVLVDSRTGLSDAGGICSIQLPDIVIAMFTANHQSLYGVRDIMRLAQQARQALAYDRMPLTVLPLPSRFGTTTEFQEAQEWLKRFEEALQEFFEDWLPRTIRPRHVLERIKIPQVDYFGFGEKLAVIDQGTSDPGGMGYAYQKVADLIANNFDDIEGLVGASTVTELQTQENQEERKTSIRGSDEYLFDLYVSYAHQSGLFEWLREFIKILGLRYELISGTPLRVFLDLQQVTVSDAFSDQIRAAIERSKLLLAIATPSYFKSKFSIAELKTFKLREDSMGLRTPISPYGLIVPVRLYGGTDVPSWFNEIQHFDFSEFVLFGSATRAFRESSRYLVFERRVADLAETVYLMLEKVPAFSRYWSVVSPQDIQPGSPLLMPPHEGS